MHVARTVLKYYSNVLGGNALVFRPSLGERYIGLLLPFRVACGTGLRETATGWGEARRSL